MSAAGLSGSGGVAAPARGARFDWKWIVIGACVALTVYISVMPLVFLLWQSFLTPQTATKAAVFTWKNYTEAYGSSETLRLFWNSVQFAVGTSFFAFVLGTTLAWMNERTNTPFKCLLPVRPVNVYLSRYIRIQISRQWYLRHLPIPLY